MRQRMLCLLVRGSRDIARRSPLTRALALARSLLALSTFLTIVCTPTNALFLRSDQYPQGVVCDASLARLSLFCLGKGATPTTTIPAVMICLAVLSGCFPALTAVPHWWVAWSFNLACPIRDGGDQVAAVLTLLIIPLLLCDRRRNHWHQDRTWIRRRWWVHALGWASLVLVWSQAAVIYVNAAIAKFAVAEWANGTALWYWVQEPNFQPPSFISWLVEVSHSTLLGAVVINYGVLVLELLAATLVFAPSLPRQVALPVLVGFHLIIAIAFGLWSFFFSISALLVLYLRIPPDVDRTVS